MFSRSLAVSIALHVGVFFGLLSMPEVRLPEPAPSEYKLAIEGKETKLVWYRLNQELPKVRPTEAKPDRRPLRADTKARQQISASPKDAPKQKQIVWTPARELPPQPAPDSPNILAMAVRLPGKLFTPPVPVRPRERDVAAPAAPPQVSARVAREFLPPVDLSVPTPNRVRVPEDAPLLASNTPEAVVGLKVRLPGKTLALPKAVPKRLSDVRFASAVPELPSSLPDAPPDLRVRLPGRRLALPVPAPGLARPEIEVAENPPAVAVVGLNPTELPVSLPVAPSPARFAAGPEIRRDGATATPDKTGLAVPDISVGGKPDLRSALRAELYASPTSPQTTREALRLARNGSAPVPREALLPAPAPRALAMKVSGAPDPRFNGRDIYMMAIQMPNLTSYSGSWLMWYADRTAKSVGLAAVLPPVAHRKVDPKYIATAAAERVQGKVQLACVIGRDGRVSNVEIVRGLDDRLNASAVEALGKWEFTPATSEGQPVDVDVLVEIPFTLAPGQAVTY